MVETDISNSQILQEKTAALRAHEAGLGAEMNENSLYNFGGLSEKLRNNEREPENNGFESSGKPVEDNLPPPPTEENTPAASNQQPSSPPHPPAKQPEPEPEAEPEPTESVNHSTRINNQNTNNASPSPQVNSRFTQEGQDKDFQEQIAQLQEQIKKHESSLTSADKRTGTLDAKLSDTLKLMELKNRMIEALKDKMDNEIALSEKEKQEKERLMAKLTNITKKLDDLKQGSKKEMLEIKEKKEKELNNYIAEKEAEIKNLQTRLENKLSASKELEKKLQYESTE